MTQRTKPPFRADHVGSLLRPQRLTDARAKAKAGEITAEALRAVEDDAIREAVALQEGVGLHAITDGEFRRDYWHIDFLSAFDGVETVWPELVNRFTTDEQPPTNKVSGKVGRSKGIFTDHFAFLASVTTETPKITIPGPAMIYMRPGRAGIDAAVYPDLEPFWEDLCAAYRAEIDGLYALGCRYLQIDDVSFAYLCDDKMRQTYADRGDDPDELLDLYIDLVNRVVGGRPDDMAVSVHMCRGNFKSGWAAQGGYERVSEKLFGDMKVDGLFLEYDSDRAGGFEPLRHVADDKIVVLGLVTSKASEMESKEDIKRRIDEATKYVPLDRLCLSPQCGFSSTHHGNALTIDDEKRKLAFVVETAAEVWGN